MSASSQAYGTAFSKGTSEKLITYVTDRAGHDLRYAIDASKNDAQPFIIGGGQIYKQAMTLADKIELTRVHESFEADTYFPKIDLTVWKETANLFHKKDTDHDHEFSFLTYERK